MSAIDINGWMASLLEQLQHSRQRQLVALQGEVSWCDVQLQALLGLQRLPLVLSNRDPGIDAIPFSKADTCLGSEAPLVVLDLFDGFNPDVLCIAAGLVRAGGVLLLLSPALADWDPQQDRYARWQDQSSARPLFAEYFFAALESDEQVGIVLTPESAPPPRSPLPELQLTRIEQGTTAEQSHVLQQLEKWLAGGKPGIALINADRGRGKSSCLGLLAQRLSSELCILVSANSRKSAAALLRLAPAVEFIAPDQLLQQAPPADLVMIDEAAMIPLSMLRQLQRIYPRLIMASTDGGYEGTGKGFMLRFVAELETRGLQRYRLEKPVRWCAGDALENWLNRTLMLATDTRTGTGESVAGYELQILTQPAAADSRALLRQAYHLLNSAHYRTRPSDLRMLMENPDQLLMLARSGDRVVGVALLNLEGGFDADLAAQVFLGRRRPRGHLLAQMLTAQAGIEDFARYRGLRVQRIAVAPACRRQGLGRALIEQALQYARDNSLDYLGASFALDTATTKFWHRLGFALVHVSYAAGKSSGNHSLAVLRAINPALDETIRQLQQRIEQQLPIWMTHFLRSMAADQVASLLHYANYHGEISLLERREVEAFAHGNKGFELCFASLQKFVMRGLARQNIDSDSLLIEKAVQNRDWKLLERESGADGRKQLQQRLRGLIEALLKAC